MSSYQLYLQGQREPICVELECTSIDQLAELAGQSRFVIGYLATTDECGCQPKLMIAASRISCAIEVN